MTHVSQDRMWAMIQVLLTQHEITETGAKLLLGILKDEEF